MGLTNDLIIAQGELNKYLGGIEYDNVTGLLTFTDNSGTYTTADFNTNATTASYSISSSVAQYATNALTASYALHSVTSSFVEHVVSSSFASSSLSSSYSTYATTAETINSVPFSSITGKPTLLSGSTQIASDISGAFDSTSASISTRLVTDEYNILQLTNKSGSYVLTAATYSLHVSMSDFATVAENAGTASRVDYNNVVNRPTLLSGSNQIATDISGAIYPVSSSLNTTNAILTPVSSSVSHNLKYRYTVGHGCNFETLQLAITWLNSNMTGPSELLLDAGIHLITDTITVNLPYTLNIRGFTIEHTYINASTGLTGKPMFDIKSGCFFGQCRLNGATLASYGTLTGENGINYTQNGVYSELKDIQICGFNKAVNIISDSEIFMFDAIICDNLSDGIYCKSTGSSNLDVEVTNFENNPSSVTLAGGVGSMFDILNNFFLTQTGQIGITYSASAYSYYDSPTITGNKWNNTGSFQKGFDFSRMDGRDANIVMLSNGGYEDKTPHCKINVVDNYKPTNIVSASGFYKAQFIATGSNYSCKFATGSDGRFTYIPKNSKDTTIWIAGSIQCDQNNRTLTVAIAKNGLSGSAQVLSPMKARTATSNTPYPFALIVYAEDTVNPTYFDLVVSSPTAGDNIIVLDYSCFTQSR